MLLRNTIIYGLTRGSAGLLNFLAVAAFSRLLTPDEYGRYALLISSVGLVSAVLFQWLRSGTRRFLAAEAQRRNVFLATVVRGYLVVLGLASLGAIVALLTRPAGVERHLLLLSLVLFAAQGWYDLTLELVLTDLQPVRFGMISLLRSALGLATAVVLAVAGLGVAGVLCGSVIGYLSSVLLLGRGAWQGSRSATSSPQLWRKLLQYGLPLTATFALEFVVSSSDRFLLGALASLDEVGRYAVSYDLGFQCVIALLMIVNLAAFPLSVRAIEAHGRAGAERQLRQHGTTLLFIALPAVVGIVMLAPNVAQVLIGPEFRSAALTVLPLIAVAALLSGLKAFYFDLSFQLGKVTHIQVGISAAAALLNVALNVWLIPQYGAAGAAGATVVAYAVGCGLSWGFGHLGVGVPLPLAEWSRVVLAAAVMGGALWPIRELRGTLALALQAGLGATVYAITAVACDAGGARAIAHRARAGWHRS